MKKIWKSLAVTLMLTLLVLVIANLPVQAQAATVEDLSYTINDGQITITDCNHYASGELIIPDTIEGYPVTSIGSWAFWNIPNLTSITIGRNVESIASEAFYECLLSHFTVDANNQHFTNDSFGVLFSKDKTTLIKAPFTLSGSYVIPSQTKYISDYAFQECERMTSVTFPTGLVSIGYYAFQNCRSLRSVTLPSSVTYIGSYAFDGCVRLKAANIPNGVTTIVYNMFSNCTSLTTAVIPESVETIKMDAFSGCANLQSITIPKSVTNIERKAFHNCLNVEKLFYTGTKAQWNKITVGHNNSAIWSGTLYTNYVQAAVKTQPVNKFMPTGKTAKFTVSASGNGLKYQWQYRTSATGSWKNVSATGSKTATLSVSTKAAVNGYQYRCKITDKYGNVIYSNAATLKIVTLKITTQPSSVTLAKGKTATFKVVAKGTGLKYQWQFRTSAKAAWKTASGTGNKTATFKVPVTAAKNGYQYRCVITDKYGNVINSAVATLKVK